MKSTIAIQSSFIAGDSRRLIERTDQGKKINVSAKTYVIVSKKLHIGNTNFELAL